jgi:hypothetical protein
MKLYGNGQQVSTLVNRQGGEGAGIKADLLRGDEILKKLIGEDYGLTNPGCKRSLRGFKPLISRRK